jgi:hypothetical protein
MTRALGFIAFATLLLSALSLPHASAGTVKIQNDQLMIDGQAQPQIFGAEVQYFRLRGGTGRNIPRAQVIALWNQALDRVVEAGMNAVSFYIPWDFHEYSEGKFDFTGTVDEDGDGQPDYPSRDVITFIQLIKAHGIKHIMVRPGPYINAEWGFLGFGAVPEWFHNKFPNSHAQNSKGQHTTLYSYSDPDFLNYSKIWLETVYKQVLKSEIGPGRPVSFIQIDNETNFQWQSIYNHDYSPRATQDYQQFLKDRYGTLAALNSQHQRNWQAWGDIKPPIQSHLNLAEDQDWYRFQDFSLFVYLKKIRSVWTSLGVTEPTVLFTLAESYNAMEDGLLPNYLYRNSPDIGMMTVNLYPKTYETVELPLLNLPFKSDHDVKAASAANEAYLGHRQSFAMGPEIQAGWWPGVNVSDAARKQTYLTTIGHGLKAFFVYYFNEGDNWQPHWMKTAIQPYFDSLKADPRYQDFDGNDLPDAFWDELNTNVASGLFVVDARGVWQSGGTHDDTLAFDAPLDGAAQPRAPYQLLKDIGTKIVGPYGDFLGKAHELEDSVCLIQDTASHVPSKNTQINSRIVNSDWAGGLLALLMHGGVNPRIHQWGINPKTDLLDAKLCSLVIYQDTGAASPELIDTLSKVIDRGGSVLNFIDSELADAIKASHPKAVCAPTPTLPMAVDGYRCQIGNGILTYAKVAIYDVFNTDFYFRIYDARARSGVLEKIISDAGITPQLKIVGGGDRTVIFARTDKAEQSLWITAKTSLHDGFTGSIQWTKADPAKTYSITNVLSSQVTQISGAALGSTGFAMTLGDSDSTAYFVTPLPPTRRRH